MTTTAPPELLDIAEMAARSGIPATTLRWYESTGLLLIPPHRTASGRRRYDAGHVRWVQLLCCLRGTGMPVAAMRTYAALVRQGQGTEAARLALLQDHRELAAARLDQARSDLAAIEAKITTYEEKRT